MVKVRAATWGPPHRVVTGVNELALTAVDGAPGVPPAPLRWPAPLR
ncbi:MAG TPA: hypothetical protein VH912_33710 [Streptosporangiaceae bacterium]|jgi:hypothetical protein